MQVRASWKEVPITYFISAFIHIIREGYLILLNYKHSLLLGVWVQVSESMRYSYLLPLWRDHMALVAEGRRRRKSKGMEQNWSNYSRQRGMKKTSSCWCNTFSTPHPIQCVEACGVVSIIQHWEHKQLRNYSPSNSKLQPSPVKKQLLTLGMLRK